jgi:hypothetical protein
MIREVHMAVPQRERGATLPMTVLVIAIMGVAVAISYMRLSSERRITADGQAQVDAMAVAQSGLSTYLANLNGKPVNPGPWTANLNVTGGTARVDMQMLRESTTTLLPAVYVITSRGIVTNGKRYDARTPPAERTVATYALWTPAPLDLDGAFTSLSGIDKNGTSGVFSGVDHCAGTGNPAIPGVAVPDGMYTGPMDPIAGSPPDDPSYLGTDGPTGTAKQQVSIDWAGIVAGTTLPANFVAPAWPTAAQFLDWPVLRANGDYTLSGDGKGILIVTGNLSMSGSVGWEGLVLVGGTVTSNGNNSIYGAVVSGLNVKLGQIVPKSAIANGNKTFQYDSCNLTRALGKQGSIQRVRNGWTDTWSSY